MRHKVKKNCESCGKIMSTKAYEKAILCMCDDCGAFTVCEACHISVREKLDKINNCTQCTYE